MTPQERRQYIELLNQSLVETKQQFRASDNSFISRVVKAVNAQEIRQPGSVKQRLKS